MLAMACSSCEDISHNEGPSQPYDFILINSVKTLFLSEVLVESKTPQPVCAGMSHWVLPKGSMGGLGAPAGVKVLP